MSHTRVKLKGLEKRPELNGQLGSAERYDEASGRLSVRLDGSKQVLGIKLCNLELLSDEGAAWEAKEAQRELAADVRAGDDQREQVADSRPQKPGPPAAAPLAAPCQTGAAVVNALAAGSPAAATSSTGIVSVSHADVPAAAETLLTAKGASAASASSSEPGSASTLARTVALGDAAYNPTTPALGDASSSPATALVEQLRLRRATLFAKNERRELDVNDIAEHSKFIEDRVKQMQAKRKEIQRKHALAHARLRREKKDVGRICSLMSQAERLESQAEEFNLNVAALNSEREWLHETDAWKGAVRELHEKYVQTASGEVIAKATLEQDEEECASFEEMLQKMKADAAEPRLEEEALLSDDDFRKSGRKTSYKKRASVPK